MAIYGRHGGTFVGNGTLTMCVLLEYIVEEFTSNLIVSIHSSGRVQLIICNRASQFFQIAMLIRGIVVGVKWVSCSQILLAQAYIWSSPKHFCLM